MQHKESHSFSRRLKYLAALGIQTWFFYLEQVQNMGAWSMSTCQMAAWKTVFSVAEKSGKSPVLPWQVRFRISAEIGTSLHFLHQAKPEPLVHTDLKPGNILLDRNYVSKISDVGLARLVPPAIADQVTQYRMTATAGTFCYVDPEYQQTRLLGVKSDIYLLGITLLQIITAKPPMGLTHHVNRAIETRKFAEMLDPAVTDWPVEEALVFAKIALQCAEMRKKEAGSRKRCLTRA